eukprot:scaffold2773_cov123-Isochrysis_galbana.AAC.2
MSRGKNKNAHPPPNHHHHRSAAPLLDLNFVCVCVCGVWLGWSWSSSCASHTRAGPPAPPTRAGPPPRWHEEEHGAQLDVTWRQVQTKTKRTKEDEKSEAETADQGGGPLRCHRVEGVLERAEHGRGGCSRHSGWDRLGIRPLLAASLIAPRPRLL